MTQQTDTKKTTLPLVYVNRTKDARWNANRQAQAWAVIARDHNGEFEVNWSHNQGQMRALAARIKDAIRFAKGRTLSDGDPPCLEEQQ